MVSDLDPSTMLPCIFNATPSYAHGHSQQTVQAHSLRTVHTSAKYLLSYLKPGLRVLDVGCGPGSITNSIAKIVHPGQVTGLDYSQAAIALAKTTYTSSNLDFIQGDLFVLPFEDNTFDIVFSHQVLVHLPHDRIKEALTEMKRVCKHGGLVTSRDGQADRGGIQVYPLEPLLMQTFEIVVKRMYSTGAGEQTGGKIYGLATELGSDNVERAFSLDVYDGKAGREVWGEQWAKRSSESAFRDFAMESAGATKEQLDAMPVAWRQWAANEEAWSTILNVEHLCWQ